MTRKKQLKRVPEKLSCWGSWETIYLILVLLALISSHSYAASDSAVKAALIADRRFNLHKSPLVSLLEVKLSEEPNLVLLERTEIDRILREQRLTHTAFHERRNVMRLASCSPCFAGKTALQAAGHELAIKLIEKIAQEIKKEK